MLAAAATATQQLRNCRATWYHSLAFLAAAAVIDDPTPLSQEQLRRALWPAPSDATTSHVQDHGRWIVDSTASPRAVKSMLSMPGFSSTLL